MRQLARFDHGQGNSTQGLLTYRGRVLESTGEYGSSRLLTRSGADLTESACYPMAPDFFAEDICPAGTDGIMVLSWRENVALHWDVEAGKVRRTLPYDGEGWGIVNAGDHYLTSDGSSTLTRRQMEDLSPVRSVQVQLAGEPLAGINAMSWSHRDTIWANIYGRDWLAEIAPETGEVESLVDATALRAAEHAIDQVDPDVPSNVLNGVCQLDADTLLLTGKCWTWMHQVALEPAQLDLAGLEALVLEMPRLYIPEQIRLMTRKTYYAQRTNAAGA